MPTFRKATIADLVTLQQFHTDLFKYEQDFEPLYNLEYDNSIDSTKYFTYRLTKSNSIVIVAEENNQLIGYICGGIHTEEWRITPKVAEVDSLFVKDGYRGQKIGDTLMDMFITWAMSKKAQRVKLEVVHNNEKSVKFYNRKGFKSTYLEVEREL
jgi:ribosomal protein S18 acetylase RimI-like enzyme